jgi:hypothetical protein
MHLPDENHDAHEDDQASDTNEADGGKPLQGRDSRSLRFPHPSFLAPERPRA